MFYGVTASPAAPEILWDPLCSRRNSISTMALTRRSPYTSLRDLLPPAIVNSPRPMTPAAHRALFYGSEISIRNRLVKQAAWAYLKPMSNLTVSVDQSFLRRFLQNSVVVAFVHFVDRLVLHPLTRAFKWLFKS